MSTENWFWLVWIGCGLLGQLLLRRQPTKFVFDNPSDLVMASVLLAFGAAFWGGPIFLLLVVLRPAQQLCPHCQRANPLPATTCRHCQRPLTLSPAEQAAHEQAQSLAEHAALAPKYARWYWLGLPLLLFFMPLLTLGWTWGLITLSNWRFAWLEPGVWALLPPPQAWVLPAMFLAMLSFSSPAQGVYRLLLRERYAEYLAYCRLSSGSDRLSPLAQWFMGLVAGGTLLFIGLLLDAYLIARPTELVINDFFSIGEKHYAYSDIRIIRRSLQLENAAQTRPLYLVDFNDGSRWSNRWDDRDPQEMAHFVAYLAEQSGHPIQSVPVLFNTDLAP